MFENIFKSPEEDIEENEEVKTAAPIQPVAKIPTHPTVVKSKEEESKVCTNCDNSGLTCSTCGFNKP